MRQVFVSYSSLDRKIAERLCGHLQDEEWNVWLDRTRIKHNWSREIAEALAQSDAVCVVWSANAAKSDWVRREWLTARALKKPIVLYRLAGAPQLPDPLGDLQTKDTPDDVRQTLRTAKPLDWRFCKPPACPHHVPFSPNPSFQGRESDLVEFYLDVIGGLRGAGVQQIGLVGMGGVGKTQLAIEIAYRFAYAFHGVFWIQASEPREWPGKLVQIARSDLRLDIASPGSSDQDHQYLVALRNYFQGKAPCLLVMDNVESPQMLNDPELFPGDFTPLSMGANLLFTARRRFDLPGVLWHAVDELPEEDAYRLITERHAPRDEADRVHARAVCNAVGRLPLALVLIAGYLRPRPGVSFEEFYQSLKDDRLGQLDQSGVTRQELATRHEAALASTLRRQWEALPGIEARNWMAMLSLFSEGAVVPLDRLRLLGAAGLFSKDREHEIHTLVEACLVQRIEKENALRMHPLVREFVCAHTPEDDRRALRHAGALSISDTYREAAALGKEFESRGIDEVIADLDLAAGWAQGSATERASQLRRALHRERHHLTRSATALSLFMQCHYRAQALGFGELASSLSMAAHKAANGTSYRVVGVSEREDPAAAAYFKCRYPAQAISADAMRALSYVGTSKFEVRDLRSGDVVCAFGIPESKRRRPKPPGRGLLSRWLQDKPKQEDHPPSLALSGDGSYAAVRSEDGSMWLFDIANARALKSWRKGAGPGFLALNHRGNLLACVPSSSYGKVWTVGVELHRWELLPFKALLLQYEGQGITVAMSGDGSAAMSNQDVWDLSHGGVLCTFESDLDSKAYALNLDGSKAAIGYRNGEVVVIDGSSGSVVRRFHGPRKEIIALAFDSSSTVVASSSLDGQVVVWKLDATTDEAAAGIRHSGEVKSVAFLPATSQCQSYSEGVLMRWEFGENVPSGRDEVKYDLISGDGMRALAKEEIDAGVPQADLFSFLTGERPSRFRLCETRTGKVLRIVQLNNQPGCFSYPRATDRAGRYAIMGRGSLGGLRPEPQLWNLETEATWEIGTFNPFGEDKVVVGLSEDGRFSLVGDGNRLQILSTADGRGTVYSKLLVSEISAIGYSTSLRLILMGGAIGEFATLDTSTGNSKMSRRHQGAIRVLACDQEGRYALTAGEDRALVLWKLEDVAEVCRLYLTNAVTALAWEENRAVYGDVAGNVGFLRITGS